MASMFGKPKPIIYNGYIPPKKDKKAHKRKKKTVEASRKKNRG